MRIHNRDRFFLFTYFVTVILLGSFLLWLPPAWQGPQRLAYIDALFTSTSAVCVTGLTSVDTSLFSSFGKLVIMLLIQFGGLGIITFMTIFLANPRGKISLASRKLIGDYYVSSVEANPRKIIRSVILFTLAIEVAGAIALYFVFRHSVGGSAGFDALFHAVSAFCNAGFSTFSNNLESYVAEPTVNFTIMGLIVLGGLGFVVMEDLIERAAGRRKRLSLHTKLVLAMTGGLIFSAAAIFLLFEWGRGYSALSPPQKVMAALFQAITPRTAGFDTVPQASLSSPSRVFTMFLMYVGASPASTGGGIKTTTFFIILVMILRGAESREDVRLLRRKLSPLSVSRGMMFALRAIAIVAVAAFLLTISELLVRPSPVQYKYFLAVLFETFSAFGTVGLSLGLTPYLTGLGKCIIILTMFAGRVGMSALAISTPRRLPQQIVDFPEEEVLIG
jgi:trk system potassium uptake protein TrkH